MAAYKLQTIDITKTFPGTVALRGISLGFEGGKIHALIGKNGAGKSTLIKILSGSMAPTGGKILVDGNEVKLNSPQDAFQKGIATVYQELSLIPDLSVGENILFGRLPKRKTLGHFIIDWPEVFRQSKAVLDTLHLDLDVRVKVRQLGVANQQVVEIAKAMSYHPSVIMLDEPTSALAHHEAENLFALLRKLSQQGVAIIYISHRLQELNKIADIVSVIRDGKLIGTIPIEQAKPERIVQMMFGEVIPKVRPAELLAEQIPVFQVKNLTRSDKFSNINFTLYRGEVLGIAGMLGSGRTELLRSIMGSDPFDEGEVILGNKNIRKPTPSLMKHQGMGLTPENRKEQGLIQVLSTRQNICLASMEKISRYGFLTRKNELPVVRRTIDALQISVTNPEQPISSLSGGNQQKVVVGNWLNTSPQIMLFDEPTRGIDVLAKQQIFQIIWDLSKKKISSIFVSSELEELLEVCHRILIMRKGKIVAEVKPEDVDLEKLFQLCMADK